MNTPEQFFHRPEMAEFFASRILSEKGASGMFLAAQRRTGKSTFIREDLKPLLESKNVEVIYVDLWTDTEADPGVLISNAIKDHLRKNKGILSQLIHKSGLEKFSLGGFQINLEKIGVGSGETISRAFEALSQETKRQIIMIIDEAQHSQSSEAGIATMFALKAARDELNSSKHYGFRLVATGSNRDKLAILVQGRDQAFLNARMVDLPTLDDTYVQWQINNSSLIHKPSFDVVSKSFVKLSCRPENLKEALERLDEIPSVNSQNVNDVFEKQVQDILDESRKVFFRFMNSLMPLQCAVLKTMALKGDNFAPYVQESYDLYKKFSSELTKENVNIDSSSVAYALESLRDKKLIWKSGRGVYMIEETQTSQWLIEEAERGINSTESVLEPRPASERG